MLIAPIGIGSLIAGQFGEVGGFTGTNEHPSS